MMKSLYLYFFTFAVASFFFGTVGLGALANLRLVIVFPLLVFAIVKSAQVPNRISPSALVAVWVFLSWCLLTCFWSENFTLSFLKVILFAVTVLAFFLGGAVLPKLYPHLNPYFSLAPILVVTVIGTLIEPNYEGGNLRGHFGNSNMQAATILFSLPWLYVEIQRQWSNRLRRYSLLVFGVTTMAMLLLSRSRTMILGALVCFSVVFTYLKPGRKVLTLYFAVALLMTIVLVRPQTIGEISRTYVFKSSTHLMESREAQMSDSLQIAKSSGALGLGFGISAGISRYWESGTFSTFSREKGNSILAIWEETGLIGAALWLVMIFVLAMSLRSCGDVLVRGSSERFVYFVSFGILLGCMVSSMGEAWVLSPSPETAVFWATMGLSFGALKSDSAVPLRMGATA